MPRLRRRERQRRGWSRDQVNFLGHIIDWMHEGEWAEHFDSCAAYGECWRDNRESALAEFTFARRGVCAGSWRFAGKRPIGWWDHEPPAGVDFRQIASRLLSYSTMWDGLFAGYAHNREPIYEPEVVALDRCGELTRDELEEYWCGDVHNDYPLLPEHLRPPEVPSYFQSSWSRYLSREQVQKYHLGGLVPNVRWASRYAESLDRQAQHEDTEPELAGRLRAWAAEIRVKLAEGGGKAHVQSFGT